MKLNTWRQYNDKEPLDVRPSSRLFNGLPILDYHFEGIGSDGFLLSDESFTAPYALRRHNFGSKITDPRHFPSLILDQIERLVPNLDVQFLVVLRNQVGLLKSQMVEEINLETYRGVQFLPVLESGLFDLQGFEVYGYGSYIENLIRLVGRQRVKVHFFEELVESPTVFYANLLGDLNLNISLPDTILQAKENSSIHKHVPADSWVYKPSILTHKQEQQIREHFFEENTRLSKLGLRSARMSDWGYI